MLNSITPGLILLDVMMPEMDGFETCRRIKQNENTKIIPVLMVTALSEKEHRLIALDIQLPGMDGIEATKLILNDSDLKNTPILAISSFAMENDKDDVLAAGIKEYITQPINKKNFLNTIKKYLN